MSSSLHDKLLIEAGCGAGRFTAILLEKGAYLDTHESITDWYKRFRSKGAIRKTQENPGATDIYFEYGGNGVEARCKKP
ncbi:MAG: hypothetical protein NTW29_21115 [Bacteroidetes bacterium]|nr:hypothetical protein [Bacteroidota bacterium]